MPNTRDDQTARRSTWIPTVLPGGRADRSRLAVGMMANGAREPANGDDTLSDAEGRDELEAFVIELRSRLHPGSRLRRDLGYALVEIEHAREQFDR